MPTTTKNIWTDSAVKAQAQAHEVSSKHLSINNL